jgi:RNA polymerase sigma factor (TIGR02999 family)
LRVSTTEAITRWLRVWQENPDDARAAEELAALAYEHLRRIARARLQRESSQPFTPTELVHEAWLNIRPPEAPLESRVQFFKLASRVMRSLLVDQARERLSLKRGGDRIRVTLSVAERERERAFNDEQLLDLERALVALGQSHPRHVEVVDLRCFGGLKLDEVSDVLGISRATVKRDLAFAHAWLADALREEERDAD